MNERAAQVAAGSLAAAMPFWTGLTVSVLAVGLWAALRILRWRLGPRLPRAWQLGGGILGAALAWLAATMCLGILGRVISFAHPWPVWVPAALAAIGLEGVPALYSLERRAVSHRLGVTLVALRVTSVLLLVLLLVQPVFTHNVSRTEEREIVVLVDTSASMRLKDDYPSAQERLLLAAMPDPTLPPTPPNTLSPLQAHSREMAAQGQDRVVWLAAIRALEPAPRLAALEREGAARRAELAEVPGRATEALSAAGEELTRLEKINAGAVTRLRQAAEAVSKAAAGATGPWPATGDPPAVAAALGAVQPLCADLSAKLNEFSAAAEALDVAVAADYMARAPAHVRTAAEAAASLPRVEVVRRLLMDGTENRPSLLDRLRKRYRVRFFTFATDPEAADPAALLPALKKAGEPVPFDQMPAAILATDTARAIAAAAEAIPGRSLSGLILFSDGRDTNRQALETAAGRLAARGVPLCAVAVGGQNIPSDASVADIEVPDSIVLKDRLLVRAALRYSRLDGTSSRVSLWEGDKKLAEQSVKVTGPDFRARVDLSHTPDTVGTHTYEVRVDPAAGEQVLENNRRRFTVAVSSDRTHLLVADDRSRWETRYLRSFFAGRDVNVQLQYVLLRPDKVDGQPERPKVFASTSRPFGEVEASALPEKSEDWMTFDAIILGDIPRASLGPAAEQALKDYVERRGGTLILIAGPKYLPHDYAGSPLESLFPFEFERGAALRWNNEIFHMRLTAEGAGHPVVTLSSSPEENAAVWKGFPGVWGRVPVRDTKASAELLMFAEPERAEPPKTPETDAAKAARSRLESQRRNGLLAVQKIGSGRVMMLAFDRTWRMRLLAGDRHHYALWGQIVRWATEGKLAFGTKHVRFGTDRPTYRPGDSITLSARLTDVNYAPVRNETVTVELRDGERVAAKQTLTPVAEVPGLYRGTMDRLQAGTFRLVLRSAAADRILAAEGASAPLATTIVVAGDQAAEFAELSADRGVLENLAARTGGLAAGPFDAARVLERLGPPTELQITPIRTTLWNTWPLLLIFVALLTAEWWLRKRKALI